MYYANCAPGNQTKRRNTHRNPYYRNNTPLANILQDDQGYIISLAIPGFSKKDILIELEDNKMRIKSNLEQEENKLKFNLREYNYNNFRRAFTLPKDVDGEKITASMEKGILTIRIPFLPEVPAKKISIK